MSSLRQLFNRRMNSYVKYSDKILEKLRPTFIPAILEMMEFSEQEITRIQWKNIRLINNFIIINGIIVYSAGEVITDGETSVTLTDETASVKSKLITASIPLKIVETATKEEIIAHIQNSRQATKDEYEKSYPQPLEVNLHTIQDYDSMDFNVSELTDNQRSALVLYENNTRDGKRRFN